MKKENAIEIFQSGVIFCLLASENHKFIYDKNTKLEKSIHLLQYEGL